MLCVMIVGRLDAGLLSGRSTQKQSRSRLDGGHLGRASISGVNSAIDRRSVRSAVTYICSPKVVLRRRRDGLAEVWRNGAGAP